MFERYTEKARCVIFFARYEASQLGSPYIETEHLLLGLLREDKALTNRFLRSSASVESIRKQVEDHTVVRESLSTSVDLPLSNECKRVLAYAAEEAEALAHKHIGTEHLLLGLLREEKCFAAEILTERGLHLPQVRTELADVVERPSTPRPQRPASDPVPQIPVRFVDAGTSERLFDYEIPSATSPLPSIGETITVRQPGTPDAPTRSFRVDNVTWVYALEKALPEEVVEVEKKIGFMVQRIESAIANHEFEKARFYQDAERAEREKLPALREKYRLDEPSGSDQEGSAHQPKPRLQEIVVTLTAL